MANFIPRRGKSSWCKFAPALLSFVFAMSILAVAEDPTTDLPTPTPTQRSGESFFNRQAIVNSPHMFGDWGGARTKLSEDKGVDFLVFEHTDLLGAVSGGNGQGFGVWNRIRGIVDIDMGKLAHVKGLSFHATALWNNGTDVAYDPRYLGTLQVTSGNDTGLHQVRMDQWWVRQDLFNKKLSVLAGQISGFVWFGWQESGLNHFMQEPLFYAPLALKNAYSNPDPYSTPGAMLQFTPNKHFYYRTAVTSNDTDYATRSGNGLGMEMRDGVAWLNNFAVLYGQTSKHGGKNYPGEAHVGFTYTGASQKIFTVVKPGITSDGNAGYWANINQAVWRTTPGSNRGLDVRAMYVWGPESKGVFEYNKQLDLSAIFNGPIKSRPQDSLNVGLNVYMIRNYLNTPQRLAAGLPVTSEKAWEINYSCWVTKWWNLMPVVLVEQDIAANPRKGNGVVVGVRSFINF